MKSSTPPPHSEQIQSLPCQQTFFTTVCLWSPCASHSYSSERRVSARAVPLAHRHSEVWFSLGKEDKSVEGAWWEGGNPVRPANEQENGSRFYRSCLKFIGSRFRHNNQMLPLTHITPACLSSSSSAQVHV
ncbi:hypothetical protein GN956_G5329 [Arapaima gigas]